MIPGRDVSLAAYISITITVRVYCMKFEIASQTKASTVRRYTSGLTKTSQQKSPENPRLSCSFPGQANSQNYILHLFKNLS